MSTGAKAGQFPSVLMVGNFLSETVGTRGVCEELAQRLRECGVPVITTSKRKARIPRILDMLLTCWSRRDAYNVAQVDVYSGPSFIWAEAVCWLLRVVRRPYVLTLHGGALPEFAERNRRRMLRLLNSAAAVTVPSRYLLAKLGKYRKDLMLLPNALELSAYHHVPRGPLQPNLIWLRAFHEIYNPTMAVRVVARLKDEFPGIRLQMLGPDKKDLSLQKTILAARNCNVEGYVHLTGQIEKCRVPGALKTGDIFLNTSNIDNTPVSVLEAMAAGLCVVSTDAGGVSDLVASGKEALLVPVNDDAAMARAIRRLLTDPMLAKRIQDSALAKVQAFDWRVVLPQWQALLASVAL